MTNNDKPGEGEYKNTKIIEKLSVRKKQSVSPYKGKYLFPHMSKKQIIRLLENKRNRNNLS